MLYKFIFYLYDGLYYVLFLSKMLKMLLNKKMCFIMYMYMNENEFWLIICKEC